ncbi:MAG: 30S ribosomal protein S17 [Candidatus Anstonellales archaeon]
MADKNDIESINEKIKQALVEERLLPRGMRLTGVVVSTKRKKTITIERALTKFLQKYKRWARIKSKINAHVPKDIDINNGDLVEIAQTRKISKTKSWVVTKIIKRAEEGEKS